MRNSNNKNKEISEKSFFNKEKFVPDTSVLISGVFRELIESGGIGGEVLIPEFVMEELRAQASRGQEMGFVGLDELKKIKDACDQKGIKYSKAGRRQTYEEIKLAKYGRIDALILDVAREENATIVTSDIVQAKVAEVEGISVKYFKPYEIEKKITIEGMITEDTMSLHLKEGTKPYAKRGRPGDVDVVVLDEKLLTVEDMERMIKEIFDATRYEKDAFVESGEYSANVIQLRNMRIAIARPPFSDGLEITVVKPVVKLSIDDYKLSDKLKERFDKKMEGVVIAGPPGSGKSTFAASIAEFLMKERKATVKTMESPKDLQVPPEITQYGPLAGSFVKTADILLLVRPDYTIYDEVRKPSDFNIFSDMRMAGIGMLGVIHASEAVDAIQRFIGKIEMGMIPHVIDTVIFIKNGEIRKVYDVTMTVRTPTGMTEADLARPVVEVKDFETGQLEYEIYSYGEENIVVPVTKTQESALAKIAKQSVLREVKEYDKQAEVEIVGDRAVVKVDNDVIPRIIGKEGRVVRELEKRMGIGIDILPRVPVLGKEVDCEAEESGAYLIFNVSNKLSGKMANFYVGERFLFSATVSKKGQVRLTKTSELGQEALKAIIKRTLKVFVG